ncbi:hypothetical protein [Plantibacter sp. Leaf314]|uniref:hypothetical protein n=1 Tax=Plantibacter sp. Leaf314 TaxID=1736333 RepID=UPI0006F1FC78|nr:hypothetical protein [Plantibacter sp. Leaf314]KQQ51857.1 hypothetical protein ASF68_05485 [Plantibacter sp. Leaf314]
MTPSTTEHIVTTTIANSGTKGMTYHALRDALSYPTNLAEIIHRLARLGALSIGSHGRWRVTPPPRTTERNEP